MDEVKKLVDIIEKARAALSRENLSCELAKNWFLAEFFLKNGVVLKDASVCFFDRKCPNCKRESGTCNFIYCSNCGTNTLIHKNDLQF